MEADGRFILKTVVKVLVAIFFIILVVLSVQFALLYVDELRATERKEYLDETAHEIVRKMSIEDKLGQVIHLAIPGKTLDSIARQEILSIRPGGIIHFGKNLGSKSEIIQLNTSLQDLAKKENLSPFLISTDQEGGRVFRVRDGVAQYPGAMAIGQTNDEKIGYQVGFITSYDLHKLGINFLLAPSLDVNNNPNNPVINTRSFGSDVDRVSLVAGAYERGARLGGAIPVIKHFPGHGDTDIDSHIGLPVIQKTLEELESLELIPFRQSINSGAPVVMTAHILYPLIDSKYPATLSKTILTDILRTRLGFDGVVITDAMEMHAISKNYQADRPGVKAILAGADILLLTSWGEASAALIEDLKEAAKAGDFLVDGINRLDEAVYRQIRLKLEYGVYKDAGFEPKIANKNLQEYMAAQEDLREKKHKDITADPNFVYETTLKTIRSYPNSFPISESSRILNSLAFLRQPRIQSEWKKQGGTNLAYSQLTAQLKKDIPLYILDASTEKDFIALESISKKYPNKKFLVLYPGSPFIKLPRQENLTILFSFSLTADSYRALVGRLFQKEEIPKVNLILK